MGMQNRQPRPPIAVREIRSLGRDEAISLHHIHNAIYPDEQVGVDRFTQDVDGLWERGGRAWILRYENRIAGFGSIAPTPGLPGLYQVDGFIAPALRRRGLAKRLLRSMIDDLAGSIVAQLHYPLSSLDSPAGRFFAAQGFYVEHEEQILVLESMDHLSQGRLDHGFTIRTLARSAAIGCFRLLYEQAFAGLPWYQPYESDQEVAADLADAGDLLFLYHDRQPVGFLWLRWPKLDTAEIEPIGLLPQYQARGLGRQLMLAGLDQAVRLGARVVTIGAWRQNTEAIDLYERLGFRESCRRIFVAHDMRPQGALPKING